LGSRIPNGLNRIDHINVARVTNC